LAETINNTDDIDKIKLAKIAFNEKISKYATIADLLNSILHFEMDNSSEKQINLLKATIDSGNILVVRALTIHSIKSKSPKWFELLEKIISDYDINNEIVDLLIYSIIHQFSPKSLLLLSRLFKFERARYYFLIVINYYMLHPQSIKVAELEQSISILDSYSASNTQIASAKKMLDKLIRLKNDS
ncbi:MAG: hypothetical protein U9N34_02570, partial [Candidatus Cloacimonadota bacterium]|nr:hypothetical protein [Candidatus Cloacimonadota bacterium]